MGYIKSFTHEIIADLHEKTDGWAAGRWSLQSLRTSGFPHGWGISPPQEIFDYFANEVFEKTDKQTQTFDNHAEHILFGLSKNHYFTTQYGYRVQDALRGGKEPHCTQRHDTLK